MKRKLCFLLMFVSLTLNLQAAELAGDFDGDSRITLKDIAYALAFYIDSNATKESLPKTAATFYNAATGPVTRLPDPVKDDFAGSSGFKLADIAVMLAYYINVDQSFSNVRGSAVSFFSDVGELSKLPGTPIGDSSFSTTITGIQTD